MRPFALSLLALLGCAPSDAPDPACGPTHAWATPDAAFDPLQAALEERFAQSDSHGMVLAVLHDGRITYATALGERDPQAGLPMTVETRSRNGSTLKMQTAAVLLALQEQGLLAVEDTLDVHLPDLDLERSPDHVAATTVHHLLSHQGGFYDYTPLEQSRAQSAYDHAHGAFASQVYAMSPPGAFYNYSNPNFALAGLVAESATGQPFAAVIDDVLWSPLCMDRATFDPEVVASDDLFASSSYPGNAGTAWTGADSFVMPFSQPAGLAWTSTLDLLHFAHLLLGGAPDVLGPEAVTALTTRHVSTEEQGDDVHYGYGVMITDGFRLGDHWYDQPLWTHGGGLPGYITEVHVLPALDAAVAVMRTGGNQGFGDLALAHLLEASGAAHRAPPVLATAPEPAVLAAAVGTYVDPFNVGTLIVREQDGALHIEAPLLDDLDLAYETTLTFAFDHSFVWNVTGWDVLVSFLERETPGEARWFRTRTFVAERADPNARHLASTARPNPTPPLLH